MDEGGGEGRREGRGERVRVGEHAMGGGRAGGSGGTGMGALATHRGMGDMRWQGTATAQLRSVGGGALAWSHLKLGLFRNDRGGGTRRRRCATGAAVSAWTACEQAVTYDSLSFMWCF
jgi:hypothetical protein